MNLSRKILISTALAGLSFAAAAQTAGNSNFFERDVEQQRRIEQGLRSGDLNVQEAARLERESSRVNRMESQALRDGSVSDAERARINQAQNRVSADIARERSDAERGNPDSASSRRMQADVQRNINEERRIADGVRSGQLTNREAARLEAGQARNNSMQARAGADGFIGRHEQRRIQGAENHQSRQIRNERHDGQYRHDGERRQAWNHHSNNRYQNTEHRQAWGGGHLGYAQQHSFQQRSFAQAGGRRGR